MQNCTQCGRPQEEKEAVCKGCGTPFLQQPDEEPMSDSSTEAAVEQGKKQPVRAAYCFKCGEALSQESLFCPACGTKAAEISLPEETVIPHIPDIPYYPSAYTPPRSQPVHQPDDSVSESESSEHSEKTQGSRSRKMAVVLFVALAVIMTIGVIFAERPGAGKKSGAPGNLERPILYIQDDSSLKFRTSDMERSQVVEGSFESHSFDKESTQRFDLHRISDNGRYLLYLNDYRQPSYDTGRGELYLRDLSYRTEDGVNEKGTRVASDVMRFDFFANGTLVYYVNRDGDLYIWDFNTSYKVDGDVADVYAASGERLFYYKNSLLSDSLDYYVTALRGNGDIDRVKVDSEITSVVGYDEALSRFIYLKTTSRRDGYRTYDVYLRDFAQGNKEKLLSDVSGVVDADAATGELLYLVSEPVVLSFEDIIEDDLKEADAEMKEPDMSEYPLLSQYYGTDDYSWLYDGYNDTDFDRMMEEYEAYMEQYREYEEKLVRDSLREVLSGELSWRTESTIQLYDLYRYTGEERMKLDSGIMTMSGSLSADVVQGDLEEGYVVYLKADLGTLSRVKFSEIESNWGFYSFSLEEHLLEQMQGDLYINLLEEKDSVLLAEHSEQIIPDTSQVYLTDQRSGVYFIARDESKSNQNIGINTYTAFYHLPYNLYYASLEEGSMVAQTRLVAENVEYFSAERSYQGNPFYVTDNGDATGDIYSVHQGEKERLCHDASILYTPAVFGDEKTICFFDHYDPQRETGEFYIFTNGQKIRIADDVYDYFYRSPNLIYLWRNYRSGKGDLYVYDGKALHRVDYDVTNILFQPEYDYFQ